MGSPVAVGLARDRPGPGGDHPLGADPRIYGRPAADPQYSRYYAAPALGDQIEIIHDPEDPKVAKTADSDDEPLLPIVGFGAISAVLLVFGLRGQRRPADQRPGQA